MPKNELSELKKYVTDQMACVKAKQPSPIQGEPDSYDYSHAAGELWAFKQVLNEIERSLAKIQHEADADEVACEVSYEMEPDEDALSVRVRQGIFDHVKAELLTWPNRDLNWKYEKGRRIAAKFMYNKVGGDD